MAQPPFFVCFVCLPFAPLIAAPAVTAHDSVLLATDERPIAGLHCLRKDADGALTHFIINSSGATGNLHGKGFCVGCRRILTMEKAERVPLGNKAVAYSKRVIKAFFV